MWAQPWAWLGLAGLAVPIAIHLLARHQAVRAAFPTLRFIDASELNAIKRQRLTDIPLLLVRLLMIALAVAAIAGPRFGSTAEATDPEPAHVTVYDMTASAAAGRSDSFVSMRRRAHVRTESLTAGIEAAAAWAVAQPGERQITVVSDFQRGSIDAAAVRLVPAGVGLRFERVNSTPPPPPNGLAVNGDRVQMAWPVRTGETAAKAIAVLAGPEQIAADQLLAAVDSVTPIPAVVDRRAAIVVFPKAAERQRMLSEMRAIDQPWMFQVAKPLLERWPSSVRVGAGEPSAGALLVVLDQEPGSLAAGEALASVAASLAEIVPPSESDVRAIDDATLKSWEKAATTVAIEREGEPQGRWLWIGVLVLLAVETGMRRRAA